MNVRGRAALAALISLALVFELPLPTGLGAALLAAPASAQGLWPVHSLARVFVREPVRRTPAPALARNAVRAVTSTNIRRLAAYTVTAPPMLKPPFHISAGSAALHGVGAVRTPGRATGAGVLLATPPPAISQCICGVCPPPPTQPPSALRRAVRPSSVGTTACPSPAPTPTPTASPTPGPIATPTPSAAPSSPPATLGASGTGINPWWRYQEENVPGGGHVMVNVGTGNLLLQDDDMSVAHKGIALAFRRTYNSQSGHDVKGSDGSPPGLYGNGWTNTLDAHLSKSADNTIWSVYDIDGARYDYAHVPGSLTWTPAAGQHATLTYDGSCGLQWTKKSGTIYYFYRPNPTATCPSLGTEGAYAGRLYQIVGRNDNIAITLTYTWDNPTAATGSNVTTITATTESGMAASLNFGMVAGHNLLQSLVWPGGTTVSYGYDTAGDLTSVALPPNNGTPPSFSDGVAPVQTYGYESSGTQQYLAWAASPRWATAPGGCSGDLKTGCGAYLLFRYAYGASAPTTSLTELDHYGFMDPTPLDGTNTPIQPMPPGGSAVATAPALAEYYALGQLGTTATPTLRDSDGHATNWVVDAAGRPTQTQECAATQNQQCSGTPLLTGETWDGSNNLTAEVDARGYQTDYAYDVNGNTVASAGPLTTIATATGNSTGRPTRLYSYDSFNNVVAFCDETWAHGNARDWNVTGNPGSSDGLCPQQAGTTRMVYGSTLHEPFGELQSMTGPATANAPSGYTHRFSYDPAQQGGTDFALPTLVQGDPIVQLDTKTRTPQQSFWYDGSGSLRCYSKGVGTWVLSYDALGRLTSAADPDDTSANASSTCGKSTGQPQWNTQTTITYFPNGQIATSQSPAERVMGVSSAFTYDLDGNQLSESHHYTCTQSCTGTTTSKWYDGDDRLVEVALPHDVNDFYPFAWLTRYVYDISGGQGTAIANQPVTAHGSLFKTQEWNTAPGATTPSWLDIKGNAFDALDRTTAKYAFQPGTNGTLTTASLAYDADAARAGLLSSTTNGEAESATYGYDERGNVSTVSFSNATNATPNRTYGYDANGRRTLEGSATYGTKYSTYDGAGNLSQVREATGGSVSSPATISYDLYPDGTRRGLGVASALLTASRLIAYSYRADGAMSSTALTYAGQSYGFDLLTYTDAGRPLLRKDPFSGKPIPYPAAPVNAGATYAPTTWSYDSSGQLSGHGMPYAYAYSGISHDAEGHILGWHTSLPSYGDVSMRFTNSNRGENVGSLLSTTTYGQISMSGVWLSHGAPVEANFHTPTIDNLDPYSGAITALHGYTEHDPYGDGVTMANCPSPNTLAATYDRAGRMRTHIVTVFDNTPITCGGDDRASSASGYGYDAEDHTVELSGDAANCAGWAGDGRLATVTGSLCGQATTGTATDTLHYDSGQILFVTDSVAGGGNATRLDPIGIVRGPCAREPPHFCR